MQGLPLFLGSMKRFGNSQCIRKIASRLCQAVHAIECLAAIEKRLHLAEFVFRAGREAKLLHAIATLEDMTRQIGELPPHGRKAFDLQRLEWFDLRNMLLVARAVAQSALLREESRGAHQREDFPATSPEWRVNQRVLLCGDELSFTKSQRAASEVTQ